MARSSLADRVLPRSFLDRLDVIFEKYNSKVHSKSKTVARDCSTKTRSERRSNLRRVFAELYQLGYRLQDPCSLKQKHVQVLAQHWDRKGLSAKTIHGLFSNLREFARWVGKDGMIGDIGTYFDGREQLVRKNAATVDLSWHARGIDVDVVLKSAKSIDARFAAMLTFQHLFGLRVKESIELRPWRATALGADHLYVTDGTKGGRHRVIPIRSDRQRVAISTARSLVGEHLTAQLRWPDLTWKQAQAHFYHLMRRLASMHDLQGLTAHGLRHGFLQQEYQHYAGLPAPIKQTGVLPRSYMEHKRAMLAVSLEAGHFRENATCTYCGSLGHQLRQRSGPYASAIENHPQQPRSVDDEAGEKS